MEKKGIEQNGIEQNGIAYKRIVKNRIEQGRKAQRNTFFLAFREQHKIETKTNLL